MENSILEMIVKATPTQKDDEFLAMLQQFSEDYPFMKEFLFDMLMKVIMRKA